MPAPASKPSSFSLPQASANRRAFTLTELLVVIGIIVLFVTLALPAFNLISGSKSIAAAENEIGALIGRARTEAVGVQDYRGLAIYRDPVTDRYSGAIVYFPVYSNFIATTTYPKYAYVTNVTGSGATAITHYYVSLTDGNLGSTPPSANWSECAPNTLDIETDSDSQTFPAGVGVQLMNNCAMSSASPSARLSNGYLPLGVVLFNGEGLMTTLKSVSFAEFGHLGVLGSFNIYGQLSIPNYAAPATSTASAGGLTLTSSFGLVAFDKQAFEGQGFYPSSQLPSQLTQATVSTTNATYSSSGEPSADKWLDANATPLLINRYNGTLIRSE